MDERGIVKKIDGPKALVLIQRSSACDSCTEGKCLVSTEGDAEMEAINVADAKIGDKVKVVTQAASYIKGSLLIYGFPALALIIGAVLGRLYLPDIVSTSDPDALSAAAGFTSLGVSLLLVKAISSKLEKKTEYNAVIEEIITEE